MEQNACYRVMNQLVAQAEQLESQDFLAGFEEKYGLKEFKISQMTPPYAAEIYHDIFIKFMKNQSAKSQLHWGQNELRLFMWILATHLQISRLRIDQLDEKDWEYFCLIFPNKQNILFEYQTISLFRQATPAKKWAATQDELFAALVRNKDGKYKWSELAKQLYISSNREYFRTPKQCRQRWLNHLDPNKSKDEWEIKQDFVLISHVFTKGKKWAQISKLLKNRRNQHSIKNRFKSLITKQQKLHPEPKEEPALVELLYNKYDNHFSKMRLINSINSRNNENSQEVKNEEVIPTTTTISDKEPIGQKVVHVLQSKDTIKIQQPEQPFHRSIEPRVSNNRTTRDYSGPGSFLDFAFQQQRQKQIRADIFLAEDPFVFLKRFFKSKDSYLWEQ